MPANSRWDLIQAFNTQTPGKYPEDNLSLLQHGESLKTRILNILIHSAEIFLKLYRFWELLYLKT